MGPFGELKVCHWALGSKVGTGQRWCFEVKACLQMFQINKPQMLIILENSLEADLDEETNWNLLSFT